MMMTSSQAMAKGKCCYPTGNKYRAGHDDGSRKSRRSAGGMTKKHTSPATHSY